VRSYGVLSGVHIGPWTVPQRAQSALINQFASQHGWRIEGMISEFVVGKALAQLFDLLKKDHAAKRIVFFSMLQLEPEVLGSKETARLLDTCELAFALEGTTAKGRDDLEAVRREIDAFRQASYLKDKAALEAVLDPSGWQVPQA